ncbi:MAG: carbamoyltransferase [Kiritimatiellia bacterium]
MSEFVLGLSAYYHDSAAALLADGQIVAAAHEERFTRIKHDASFPAKAVSYVLSEAGLTLDRVGAISFYDKPYLKFERLLETYHAFAPKGYRSFLTAMPVWAKEKLFMRDNIRDELKKLGLGEPGRVLFPEHHLSHAASAFYPSPFEEAAIMTVDGVGEWATTTIGYGHDGKIEVLRQLDFPHSLGLLYSAFTYYCGFKVNSGEYKLMGLAPYGNPRSDVFKKCKRAMVEELVDIRHDGSIVLNMAFFNFAVGLTMCVDEKWMDLFGIPRRQAETNLTQPYMDMALAIQEVTEEIVLKMAETARSLTDSKYLVMAGGVALNCVANGKLLKKRIFEDLWIQPAAGDAGGALGAAFAAYHIALGRERKVVAGRDAMQGAYLGPEFSNLDAKRAVRPYGAPFHEFSDYQELCNCVVDLLAEGKVVGWFQGRMEYGPRALGNRSILGDARQPDMQKKLNLKIKYREGFRPFAPSVLEEELAEYFDLDRPSPYMLLVAPVRENRRTPLPEGYEQKELLERLYHVRSDMPAITHVDYSARVQSVDRKTNERYWSLIHAFQRKTGLGVIVNTSFNVRGEPIVCTPADAYACFMRTEMDALVINDLVFHKSAQPVWQGGDEWTRQYGLD